jgi:cardiolipin synthase
MSLFTLGVAVYVVAVTAYIVSENRRPQSAFAWLFALITLPGLGVVIYILFGRMRGGVGRTRRLIRQSLPGHLGTTLAPLLAEHERGLERLGRALGPSARLANLVSSASPAVLTTSNRVEVLEDARAMYPRLTADIEEARASVHLQFYIWRPDALGERLLALLARKVREGVEVRLLYDPVGSIGAFGIPMLLYRRRARRAGIDMRPTAPLWRVHTVSYRDHRKIAVIDGRVGYTGGLNMGAEHLDPGPGFARWRDTHLRMEGLAVRALQAVFAIDWANATGDGLLPPSHFPPLGPGFEGVHLPVQLVTSGPDSDWRAVRQQYFGMVTAASRRVRVQTPYFVIEDSLTEALKAAALSGVDVSLMIAKREPGHRLVHWAARTYFADVAAAGVEVLLYDGGFLHAKTVVVDGEVASVGSGNWDIRSFSINYELNALIHDRGVAREIEAAYERDRAACIRFDPEAYRTGPRLRRFRDSAARLVSPLL